MKPIMNLRKSQRAALFLMVTAPVAAMIAPRFAPNDPTTQFADRAYAPPTPIHVRDANGFRMPFVYPLVLEDRVARRYREDETTPVAVTWLSGGRVIGTA